jgi:DNA-binding response OmpR family regulator
VRVLVIDDDADVRSVLLRALERDGHVVSEARDLAGARRALESGPLDVIVLDVGLPDGSGIDLLRALRAERESTPVLVVTARSEVARRVEGLDAGADDFLAKPFAVAELRARVRVLGRRRATPLATPLLTIDDACVDLNARRATRSHQTVSITPREWSILDALAARRGRVVPRSVILDEVWGEGGETHQASLEVLVARIRKKLGERVLRTVRGEGYALGEP